MLSRIFWLGLAAVALIGGMIWQDGGRILSWGDETQVSGSMDRQIEARIDSAIDRSFDKMEVVGTDGKEIDVAPETKRAMADAVQRLVKAKTELAMLRVQGASDEETRAVEARSDRARADIEWLKGQIKAQEQAATGEQDALRQQIQQEVREEVRTAVRDAVRN